MAGFVLSNGSDSFNCTLQQEEGTSRPAAELESSFCQFAMSNDLTISLGCLGFGLAAVIMLSAKRTHLWPNILGGRPGLVIPVNLLEGRCNRHVYVTAFCSMTAAILRFVFNSFTNTTPTPWTGTLLALEFVLLASLAYAVVVMAIDSPIPILGYPIGLVYSILVFSLSILITAKCWTAVYQPATNVLLQLPHLFLFYLICWFGYRLVKEVLRLRSAPIYIYFQLDNAPVEVEYVRKKLRREAKPLSDSSSQQTSTSKVITFIRKQMYESDPTFRYSTKMLVTVGVSAVCIWEVAVIAMTIGINLDSSLHDFSNVVKAGVGGDKNENSSVSRYLINLSKWIADGVPACYYGAAIVSSLITVIHLLHILSSYRKHMKRLYCGDTFFLPREKAGPTGIVTASLRYSGYQIAYLLWGWLIEFFVLFLIFFVLSIAFHFDLISFVEILKAVAPSIVFGVIIFGGQFILVRFVFLSDNGEYANINNRRLFDICAFFLFFYNTLVGLISCLGRIMTGLVLGTLLVDRLDRSTLPRGWEAFDPGFNSYVGYILLEHMHSNPYLVTFLYLLGKETANSTSVADSLEQSDDHQAVQSDYGQFVGNRSRRIRNKWLVAYTLINNPSLLKLRDRKVDKMEHAMLLVRGTRKTESIIESLN